MLADSGYTPANPPEWIGKLSPEVVLVSVAAGDREGRPDSETLEALEDYTLLRTDRDGWIELVTDGEQMCVEVEKRQNGRRVEGGSFLAMLWEGRPEPDLRGECG